MYSNVKKVSVLKMFEDVRRCSRTWGSGPPRWHRSRIRYTLYPIPYTTREGFLSIQVAQQRRHFYLSGTRECLLFVNL
jgi:hypothetical protein